MVSYIESSVAFPFVIACSLFSIVWGVINILLVSERSIKITHC